MYLNISQLCSKPLYLDMNSDILRAICSVSLIFILYTHDGGGGTPFCYKGIQIDIEYLCSTAQLSASLIFAVTILRSVETHLQHSICM